MKIHSISLLFLTTQGAMIILNRSETMPKIIDKTFCRLDSACISNLINIYIVKKLRFVYLIYRGGIAALLQIGGWVVQIGFLILVLCLGSLQIIYGCSYEELDSPDFNPPIYLSDLEEDCIDSATTIGSISDDQSDGSQQTEDDIIKNIIDLATKFGKRDAPKNAQKGAGLTSERVLIALATLLMEKATCAAVFFVPKEYGLSESNQDMLWIGHNQGLKCVPSLIKRISTKIFSASLPRLHRNELLSDKEVRAILSLTSNQGREKAKYTRTLTQEADAMIHWFKKVARLREYVDCKTELGRIAKCLKENQIKYLCKSGIHAEMNILNELYDNDMLFDTGGYFGISKGCCLICGAVLEVLCTESEPYQANGCHFGVYNKWPVPSFLKDEKVLRKFTGKSVKDDKERGKFFDTIPLSDDFVEFF
jgi:hypothetical protein